MQHLKEAIKLEKQPKADLSNVEKLRHILGIWNQGRGIVIMRLFNCIGEEEAFMRESAMIAAIGKFFRDIQTFKVSNFRR